MFYFYALLIIAFHFSLLLPTNADDNNNSLTMIDKQGYVIFCLCMGRFGNQAEHFLGAMSFAKNLNRTLVVPPFITYKNVPYSEWFKLEKLKEFHRVIAAEDFMKYIAPQIWPKGKRNGFCWLPSSSGMNKEHCQMMFGNPSTQFWTDLGVDKFDDSIIFTHGFFDYSEWLDKYPSENYPVIALKGAPASYPMVAQDRKNQKYMIWSDSILEQANDYIRKTFNSEQFIAIHLRNGLDWENACNHINDEYTNYMASPQCLDDNNLNRKLTKELCLPSKQIILDQLEVVVKEKQIKNIYIATDKDPMLNEIKNRLKFIPNLNVVFHDPWLPVLDVAIMTQSDFFIGNCVSSFTSFVKRYRDINNKESTFWTFF